MTTKRKKLNQDDLKSGESPASIEKPKIIEVWENLIDLKDALAAIEEAKIKGTVSLDVFKNLLSDKT